MKINLINGEKNLEVSLKPVSGAVKVKAREIERAINTEMQTEIDNEVKGFQTNSTKYINPFQYMDILVEANIAAQSGAEYKADPEFAKNIVNDVMAAVKDIFDDKKAIEICKILIDTSKMKDKEKELIGSNWDGDFWANQDLSEVGKATDYFRNGGI